MAPTWVPKWSQNGPKINGEIDQKSDVFLDAFFVRFWSISGGKMESSWHQNRIPNRCQLRKAFFHETHSRCSGGSFCRIKRVEVGSKHGPKIDQKMGSTRKGILASIFISITAHLGAILALSGPILAHIGSILAPSWPHLGLSWPSWRHLGLHLGVIFASLGPPWLHFRRS